jgi:hypothetical protein
MKLKDIILSPNRCDIFIIDKNTITNINIIIGNGEPITSGIGNSLLPSARYVDVDPIYWEDDFLKVIQRFKYGSNTPNPYIFSINKIIPLYRKSFTNIEDIHSYLDKEVGDPVIFSFKKTCDILNLQTGYIYEIRIGFIKDLSDIREEKLNDLI